MTRAPEVRVFESPADVATEAADFFLWLGDQAIRRSGRFLVALSGGSTPKALYSSLCGPAHRNRLDWSRVEFCFGDERCVPPSHPDSNFGLARDYLFTPLNIAHGKIHRMEGEADPSAAATAYEYRLRQLVGEADERWPRFDLILLGLGEDGHTASLFPGTAAAQEKTRWVTPGSAPTGTRQRLTLTTGVINHAGVVLFLVTGASKAPVARKVLEGGATAAASYPAAAVQPDEGRLLWFLDRSAAADLTASKREFSSEEA
ncbi:MAG: 6-phosphogluconolactonase [Nitrospiraceae bacterium]|nr:6-phosphogluconolactonase [Nitrospiraceae bacterium]